MEMKTWDLNCVKCIKDEDPRVYVKERRLKIDENFNLINVLNEFIYERGELSNPTDDRKFWFVQRIRI